jgi:hypothetical protein
MFVDLGRCEVQSDLIGRHDLGYALSEPGTALDRLNRQPHKEMLQRPSRLLGSSAVDCCFWQRFTKSLLGRAYSTKSNIATAIW